MTVRDNNSTIAQSSFTCDTCGTSYKSREALRQHNIEIHSNNNARGAEKGRRTNIIKLPEPRTTFLLVGVMAGLIGAGIAAYFVTKGRRTSETMPAGDTS